jgi:hypothetical protein
VLPEKIANEKRLQTDGNIEQLRKKMTKIRMHLFMEE